uniref:Uncharacterized protein n=1 Tax=Glossina brevipalpis TaxID=37001 RepID=A0A1A9X416_9MUSC
MPDLMRKRRLHSFVEQSNGKIATRQNQLFQNFPAQTTQLLINSQQNRMPMEEIVSQNNTEAEHQEMHQPKQRLCIMNCLRTTLAAQDADENSAAKNLNIVDVQQNKTTVLRNNIGINSSMASTCLYILLIGLDFAVGDSLKSIDRAPITMLLFSPECQPYPVICPGINLIQVLAILTFTTSSSTTAISERTAGNKK